jgi:hypothetical protein
MNWLHAYAHILGLAHVAMIWKKFWLQKYASRANQKAKQLLKAA